MLIETDKPDLDENLLAHYGVKGMKWGKHTAATKVTRKQNRQLNRDAAAKFNADKAGKLYGQAKKLGDKVLIETSTPGSAAKTIITGKQFAQHLEAGGVFDVRATEVFAKQPAKGGKYVLNEQKIGSYQKQDFRKS
jgi:hypothetical protein